MLKTFIDNHNLAAIMPLSTLDSRDRFIDAINHAMLEYRISTPMRMAAFLAQVGHESAQLSGIIESTYYSSAERLLDLFKNDFKDLLDAKKYTRSPERCANRIYANQNGNGGEESGDGWRYRGRGLIHITGRRNYAECGEAIGLDLLSRPELLEEPLNACRSAAWYWNRHGCNDLADVGMFDAITKRINGGYNGAKERMALYVNAKKVLSI